MSPKHPPPRPPKHRPHNPETPHPRPLKHPLHDPRNIILLFSRVLHSVVSGVCSEWGMEHNPVNFVVCLAMFVISHAWLNTQVTLNTNNILSTLNLWKPYTQQGILLQNVSWILKKGYIKTQTLF